MSGSIRFSYGGDPSFSASDAVRFLVGDTNAKRPLLDDREVAHAISKYTDQNLAAAFLADHLFGKFAAMSDFSVGPVRKNYSKVAELFKLKAQYLRDESAKLAIPSFPATTHASKDTLSQNTGLTEPSFSVGISDNPFAVQIGGNLDRVNFNGFE
jgi:hypothetical protein